VNRIEHTIRRLDQFQQRHAALAFPFAVMQKFGNDQGGAFATRLAYRGLFALFPLLLLSTTVFGFVLSGHPGLQHRVTTSALAQFPIIGSQLGSAAAHPLRGSAPALIVGIAGTVWGTLGLGQAAENAMNAVWNIPYVQWPNFFLRRARSGLLIVALGVATLLSAALATFASRLGSGIAVPFAYAGSVLITFAMFTVAFTVLTAEPVGWREVASGAAIATVFWQGLQAIGGWYVARELRGASNTYGFFAIVIVLLSWMFLAAQLVLMAVEINVVRKYHLWPRSLTQPPLTEADRETFARLARMEIRRPEYEVHVTFKPEADFDPLTER